MSSLFDLSAVKQLSPRMQLIQYHDIQWHKSSFYDDDPYLVIPMKAARDLIDPNNDEELETIADMTASYGRLLDDAGMTFSGSNKEDLITEAIAKSIQYFKEQEAINE